jgi:RNA polymerase sigma-70 factor (ECF subfamily)
MAFREVTERWAQWRFERQAKELLEPLYRVALRLTGKHEDAEDLVQDTIIKAYRAFARARFDGPAGERAWFFTILANGFRDGYRRRRRTPEVPFAALEDDAESNVIELVPDLAPGPDLQADATLFREAAQAVIERLPPEVRLEVWRAETAEPLLHPNDPDVVAVASDTKVETSLTLLNLNDHDCIAAFILDHVRLA